MKLLRGRGRCEARGTPGAADLLTFPALMIRVVAVVAVAEKGDKARPQQRCRPAIITTTTTTAAAAITDIASLFIAVNSVYYNLAFLSS